MIETSGIIICLSYILGLLFTAIPGGGVWILLLSVLGSVLFRPIYTNLRKLALKRAGAVGKNKAVANDWIDAPHPKIW
ncbi:MAG: hypothetical protein ACK5RD_01690, partial [Aphanizomenon sp.]